MKTIFRFEKSNIEEARNFVRATNGYWTDSWDYIVEDEEDATDLAHELTIEGFEFAAIEA